MNMEQQHWYENRREGIVWLLESIGFHVFFLRYMGGRFLHAVDRMSRVGSSSLRELYAPALSKFSIPDPKSQGVHESDLDSLYYPHIIHRHLGLRYPAKKG